LKKTSPEMAQLLKSSLANRRLILLDGILNRFLLLIVNIFNYIKSTFGKVSALLPFTLIYFINVFVAKLRSTAGKFLIWKERGREKEKERVSKT
jgi:hypothetical protein